MKKIISVLLLIFMLSNSVVVFADATVDTSAPSNRFYNDLTSFADGAKVDEVVFGINSSHPVDYEFKNGEYIASRKDGSTTTGLTYIFYGNHNYDSFSFGFDIKFSGITSNSGSSVYSVVPGTSSTVFQDQIQARIDSGELYVDGSKAISYETGNTVSTKTAWCFYKSGQSKSIIFSTKKSGTSFINGANGQPAIYLGDAELLQDTFYTVKVNVDQVGKKYNTVIITADGTTIETGISGSVQDAFYGLYKLDNSIASSVNDTATITLDNLFVANTTTRISVPEFSHVSGDGTISFSATLPDDFLNPKVYINDTFIEKLTLNGSTSNDYVITAALPDGTHFGPGKVEVLGTCEGEAVSLSSNTVFTKFFQSNSQYFETPDPSVKNTFGFRNFSGTGALSVPQDNLGVWALKGSGQIDVTKLETPLNGIVEFSFDFNTEVKLESFRLRMTANTSDGSAFFWNNTKGTYHYFTNGYPYTFGSNNISYETNKWNTIKIRADYYNHKYYFYLNNILAEEGYFTDVDGQTNQVVDVRMNFGAGAEDSMVYLDNFKFTEYSFIGANSPSIYAVYSDTSSKAYEGEPISAANLSSVNFETGIPFDSESITNETAMLVNESCETVNSSVLCSNGIIKAICDGDTLPDGNYKLIVTENALVAGEKLGLCYEIPVSFSTSTFIISPVSGSSFSESALLSVYAPDADKVVFAVNSEIVASFNGEVSPDSVYSCEYATEEYGNKILDVFLHKGEKIEVLSTSFKYNKSYNSEYKNYGFGFITDTNYIEANTNVVTSEITKDSAAGKDDIFQITSLVGTNGINDISKSCVNFQPKPANSAVIRRMVTEYDIKVDENTVVYLEIGASLTGQTYGANSSSYTTVAFRGSGGKAHLFASDGTILGTTKTFEPGKWYNVRHIIDYDNLTVSYYIDNQLVVNDTITESNVPGASKYPDWEKNIASTYKYRILFYPKDKSKVTDDETSQPARVSLDNCKRWTVSTIPEVLTLNGGNNYIITEGTDKIEISLTKPFDHDNIIPFPPDLIEVFVNDEKYDAKVNVTDGANFEISGLGIIKHNSLIEIKFSDLCMYNNATIDKVLSIPIYVKSSKGLCIFPLAAGENSAYAKYINESDEANIIIGISKYDKSSSKLIETDICGKQITGRSSGVICASLADKNISDYNFKAFLWNGNDLSPVFSK